jgi:hypothetical protein
MVKVFAMWATTHSVFVALFYPEATLTTRICAAILTLLSCIYISVEEFEK